MLVHVGRAGRLLFHSRDEGFSTCMFNRQTYGPRSPRAPAHPPPPDYAQWSFWHRHLACFITLRGSHSSQPSHCCTAFLMRPQLGPQIVRSNKEGTHASINGCTPGQINVLTSDTHVHKAALTILFAFSCMLAPTQFSLASHSRGTTWLISMGTVCAVLLQLWCMWWHF